MKSLCFPLSSTSNPPPSLSPFRKHKPQQLQKPTSLPSILSFPCRPSSSPHAYALPRLSVSYNQDSASASAIPIQEIIEKDWSFVVSDSVNSPSERADKISRIISAARIDPSSRVLVSHGHEDFVEQLVGSVAHSPSSSHKQKKPLELLLVVHDSLFVLATIKERYDDGVRCWQGPVVEVPQKWAPFDAVFFCYLPGLGLSLDQVFAAMAGRCSSGARMAIGYAQGRETVERHLKQYPDMVTSALPKKHTLEKVAADHSFKVTVFVDEPTFYLAVMEFCKL